MKKYNKGFTLIELIVVMAVIGVLVLLAMPKFMGYTKKAHLTEIKSNMKQLENASERYYMDNQNWPKLSDDAYTAEELESFAQSIKDKTGQIVTIDTEGKYYDIDYNKLQKYVQKPKDNINYIIQNPIGEVYYLENINENGINRIVNAEKAKITTFEYNGNYQTWTAPKTGTYLLEVWGAQGGKEFSYIGGLGGYSKGKIQLNKDDILYIYVGERGKDAVTSNKLMTGGWNGGGSGRYGASGGGATDIRTVSGTWNNLTSLQSRIIVGGGGGGAEDGSNARNGGAGGGLSGGAGNVAGGTQTSGNALGAGGSYTDSMNGAGGGGGYWGGKAAYGAAGGGGSGYIGSLIDGETSAGVQQGNGLAKITFIE